VFPLCTNKDLELFIKALLHIYINFPTMYTFCISFFLPVLPALFDTSKTLNAVVALAQAGQVNSLVIAAASSRWLVASSLEI
jgi:hypothetical protein